MTSFDSNPGKAMTKGICQKEMALKSPGEGPMFPSNVEKTAKGANIASSAFDLREERKLNDKDQEDLYSFSYLSQRNGRQQCSICPDSYRHPQRDRDCRGCLQYCHQRSGVRRLRSAGGEPDSAIEWNGHRVHNLRQRTGQHDYPRSRRECGRRVHRCSAAAATEVRYGHAWLFPLSEQHPHDSMG